VSVASDADVRQWLELGWPGLYVVKPQLLGRPEENLARLKAQKSEVVFTSALETGIGAQRALRLALAHQGEGGRALGFGVWPLFEDSCLDGPDLAPFIREQDIDRNDGEAIWNALS
jgi:O-succinylbenzoate synthase